MPLLENDVVELHEESSCNYSRDTILFVCTGNTCRSPMCAALFNAKYAGLTRHASSAGLFADGSPISENSVRALMNMGVKSTPDNSYLSHVSHTVNEGELDDAFLIVGVSSSHALQLIVRFPAYASKITSLPIEISDPFGGSPKDYENCLKDIESALNIMFGHDIDNES